MFQSGETPTTLPSDLENTPAQPLVGAPMGPAGGTRLGRAADADVRALTFEQLLAELERRVERFQAEAYTGDQAVELVQRFDRLARLATVAGVLAAGRVQATRAWAAGGARTAQAWLASTADIDVGEAGRRLKLAERLDAHPELERLARSGDVSMRKVELAATTADKVPSAAGDLARAARKEDVGTFRATCVRHRLESEPDEERQARHRRERFCRARIDAEGAFSLVARGPAAEGAELLGVLRAYTDDALRRLVAAGEVGQVDDLGGAAAWDALVDLTRVAGSPSAAVDDESTDADRSARARPPARLRRSPGSQVKVIFRVDAEAARRGHVVGDEVCEIAGVGPVDLATVDRVVADGAFVAAVTTGPVPPAAGKRLTSEHQALDTPTECHHDPPEGTTERRERVERVHHHGRSGRTPGVAPDPATDRARTIGLVDEVTAALATAPDLYRYLHRGRRPTALQLTALDWRDPVCSVPGCTMPVGLENDHTETWIDTKVTTIDDLNRRCRTHHREKTAAENRARARARARATPPTVTAPASDEAASHPPSTRVP